MNIIRPVAITDAMLGGSSLVSGWTNIISDPFETFIASGVGITSAINTSDYGACFSNQFPAIVGETYEITFGCTLVSGNCYIRVTQYSNGTGVLSLDSTPVVNGANKFYFTAASGLLYVGLWSGPGGVGNFAISDFVLRREVSNVPETDYPEFAMGTTYPPGTRVMDTTGVEILTLDVAPATDWAVGDLLTGQSSGKTCRAVAKLTALTYQIRERTGVFTLGEVIGVTGTGAKLADQGAAHPTITATANNVHKVFESLSAGLELLTLDVAPATPWLPDWIITGQTSGKTCRIVLLLTSLTYLVKDRTGAFTLGEVIGVTGTAVLLADQGAANPTFAAAANVGNYPPTDLLRATPLWWKEVSSTNRWKAFDVKVGSQTEQASLISYQIKPGLIDSVAFLNVDASSISLTVTDPVEGEVYNETISLVSVLSFVDWYGYFFEPVGTRITDVVRFAIPLYASATLDIAIAYAASGIAKVGAIIMGLKSLLGVTLYNPVLGITDYSVKTADEYGNYTILERAYSKRMTCDMRILNTSLDEVHRLLAIYRSTPVVWVGIAEYSSMIVYGFYKDFSIVMPGPRHSDCSIEIEGMT